MMMTTLLFTSPKDKNKKPSICTTQLSSVTELDTPLRKVINKLLKQDLTKLISTDLWALFSGKKALLGLPCTFLKVLSCFLWVTFET